jgi:hypothetical protein
LGEAFLDKASGLHLKFVARMLRPYKNRDSFPEITKEGLYQFHKIALQIDPPSPPYQGRNKKSICSNDLGNRACSKFWHLRSQQSVGRYSLQHKIERKLQQM